MIFHVRCCKFKIHIGSLLDIDPYLYSTKKLGKFLTLITHYSELIAISWTWNMEFLTAYRNLSKGIGVIFLLFSLYLYVRFESQYEFRTGTGLFRTSFWDLLPLRTWRWAAFVPFLYFSTYLELIWHSVLFYLATWILPEWMREYPGIVELCGYKLEYASSGHQFNLWYQRVRYRCV
jgi:hypothetical protein